MDGVDPSPRPGSRSTLTSARLDRRALLGAGGGALALALAACGGGDDDDGPAEPTETSELTALIELERRAAATLASGARFSNGAEAREFTSLESDSLAHVGALEILIERAGGTPPPAPDVPIAAFVRDSESARTASLSISDRLAKGYVSAVDVSTSAERRRDLTTLLGNIAQRQIVLGGLPKSRPTFVNPDG